MCFSGLLEDEIRGQLGLALGAGELARKWGGGSIGVCGVVLGLITPFGALGALESGKKGPDPTANP